MASSSYASGDLYHFTRGATYTGMDLAGGFLLPIGKAKAAGSVGKAILRAEKIAYSSEALLKTSLVSCKVFKSSKHSSHLKDKVKPIWSTTKKRSSVKNAYRHWKDHRSEFPDLVNAKQYVEHAHDFYAGSRGHLLKKVRQSGEILLYDIQSNTFG